MLPVTDVAWFSPECHAASSARTQLGDNTLKGLQALSESSLVDQFAVNLKIQVHGSIPFITSSRRLEWPN
jgi:hypothetical protein